MVEPITLLHPIAEEKWAVGTSQNITWSSTTAIPGFIQISLFKNEVWLSTIDWVYNVGSYIWTIPVNTIVGSDYHIKLESIDNPAIWNWDTWIRKFEITPSLPWKCSDRSTNTCIQDINGSYNTEALCKAAAECQPITSYACSGAPNYSCDIDPNGPYVSKPACQAVCVAPSPITTYKCSGAPNYTCSAVTDGSGQYATLAACQAACKAPYVSPPRNILMDIVYVLGIATLLILVTIYL